MQSGFLSALDDIIWDSMARLGAVSEVKIDGKVMRVIFDNDQLKRREDRAGVAIGEKLMYARARDFARRPAPGRQMRIESDLMIVTQCVEQDGVYEITLSANRAG